MGEAKDLVKLMVVNDCNNDKCTKWGAWKNSGKHLKFRCYEIKFGSIFSTKVYYSSTT